MADVIKPDFVGVLALRLHPHVCAKIATALPGINDSLRCRVSVTASDLVAHAASAKKSPRLGCTPKQSRMPHVELNEISLLGRSGGIPFNASLA